MDIKRQCKTCIFLQMFDILNNTNEPNLWKYCNTVFFKKNENIFRQNTPSNYIIYVEEGLIKIVKELRNENHLIFKILKGPAYVEISSIFGTFYNYSAYALIDSRICFISKEWFGNALEENGKFAKIILEMNSKEETNSTNRLLSLLRKQVPGRMADVLLYFSKQIFKSNEFDLPLNRNELADFIGVSKKSFIRTLNEFKNDKLILVDGRKIHIVREDLLQMLSRMG